MSNYSHRSLLLGDFFLKAEPFEKAAAGRTNEVEERHPYEEQGDDGDGNNNGDDFVRHDFLREPYRAAGLNRLRRPQPNGGAGYHQKFGSESIRSGEDLLIREQGPVRVERDGLLRQEEYDTGCDWRPCGCGRRFS